MENKNNINQINNTKMKKVLFLLFFAATFMEMRAQLVVSSNGKVGIGTSNNTEDMLRIVKPNHANMANYRGLKVSSYNTFGRNIGIESRAVGGSSFTCAIQAGVDSTYYYPAAGILGYATWGRSVAIFGTTYMNTYTNMNDTTICPIPLYGRYAGLFHGTVRVKGPLYSDSYMTPMGNANSLNSSMTPISDSSSQLTNGIRERVTDKLDRVQPVQFLRYNPTIRQDNAKLSQSEDQIGGEQIDKFSDEEMLSPIQYGIDPIQLKEVYPELVFEDKGGNISVNYVEMIPLLIQSIKELSHELAELKGTSVKKAKAKTETTSIDESASEVDMVRMDQNKPNPFSESTVITLNIPEKTQKANIFIYDMSGKQVQAIPVNERGETNITVYASDLSAGMYIYTLVVDGKVVVTRKMIVSEA